MALSVPLKTELNESCRKIVKDAVREDYSRNKAAVERVVASLHDDDSRFGGWVLEGWIDFASRVRKERPLMNWTTAGHLSIRRVYRVRITRSPEHQALVERLGEVAPKDNTYVRFVIQHRSASVGDPHIARTAETYDSPLEAAIGLCKNASLVGHRPQGRVGDNS